VSEPVPILQVLLFRDDKASQELGPTLWAAFQEVENLYNTGRARGAFRRYYMAESVPPGVLPGLPPGWESLRAILRTQDVWRAAAGKYTRTYDHVKLAERVRSLLSPEAGPEFRLLLVTDQEITPPPEWRYMLWAGNNYEEVVSTAPMDPLYWEQDEPHRLMTIKHRARVACCCVVGEFVGLKRCNNSHCFLHTPVDSVTELDAQVRVGKEHKIRELTGRGFSTSADDPARVQDVVTSPTPRVRNE
jgi:hypothetical protein